MTNVANKLFLKLLLRQAALLRHTTRQWNSPPYSENKNPRLYCLKAMLQLLLLLLLKSCSGRYYHGQVTSATWLNTVFTVKKHRVAVLSRLCRYVDLTGTRLQMRRAIGPGVEHSIPWWSWAESCSCTVHSWYAAVWRQDRGFLCGQRKLWHILGFQLVRSCWWLCKNVPIFGYNSDRNCQSEHFKGDN